MSTDATQPAKRLLGRYALHGEIASGGMASVHLGRLLGPVGFARTVAIKKLHPQFAKDPAFVAMFLDEARLAARIRHPNVVPTLDVVQTDDEIFLVMEYVQGESLSRLIKSASVRDERVPPAIACSIVAQTLLGLHAAHEAKSERGKPLEIVHRDVSPHNVLVGVDGIARVLDFGIAKATSRLQTTQDGQLKGKLAYMAPEQIERSDVDRRADVYAAAVVLWETLTARRLFVETSPAHLMKLVLDGKVSKPSELAPDLPPHVEAIVMKGLSRDPDARFATAEEMAIALEETGCIAKPRAVGEFVDRAAHEALTKRAEKVAEIEGASEIIETSPSRASERSSSSAAAGTTTHATAAATATVIDGSRTIADPEAGSLLVTNVSSVWREAARARRGRVIAVGAVLIAGLGVGVWAMGRAGKNEASTPTTSTFSLPSSPSSAPVPAFASTPAPVTAPESAAATGSASASVAVAAAASAHAPSSSTTPAAVKKKTPKKPANCSPPYTIDAQGVRIPKLECL